MYTHEKDEMHKNFVQKMWREEMSWNKLQTLELMLNLKDKCSKCLVWIHLAY